MSNINDVLSKKRKDLLKKPHVVGVGRGLKRIRGAKTDKSSIIVFVDKKVDQTELDPQDIVPKEIEDITTDVVEVGEVSLLNARTQRQRPAQPGMSIGHYKITAGTFGAVVKDARTKQPLILSNNHVIANLTFGNDGKASSGDAIVQPGTYDGGKVDSDVIARLERYVPLKHTSEEADCEIAQKFEEVINLILKIIRPSYQVKLFRIQEAENLVDCAVARPISNDPISDEILQLGHISGVAQAQEGAVMKKSGRTTGVTTGEIVATDASISVKLTDDRSGMFVDQIITTRMSQGGDSGSLGLNNDNAAVGLLFAGSDKVTVFNKIQNVINTLGIEF